MAIVVSYLALAVPSAILSSSVTAFASAGFVAFMVPIGVLLAVAKPNIFALVAMGLIAATAVIFLVRMPGWARVPLLLIVFAGCYYCTDQAGTAIG